MRTRSGRPRWGGLLVLVLTGLLAGEARAIGCRQWQRMGPDQKAATIDRMIRSTVSSSGGRQYRLDRGAVGRCLEDRAQRIQYDFDGICEDPRTAGMDALNTRFKRYIWTCAG